MTVFRPGKTRRDRESGATQQGVDNKLERAAWHNRSNLSAPFPAHTCNGKRNRIKVGKPFKG